MTEQSENIEDDKVEEVAPHKFGIAKFVWALKMITTFTFLICCFVVLGYLLVFSGAPLFERYVFPVGGNFKATEVDIANPNKTAIRLTGEKYRKCTKLELIGLAEVGGVFQRAKLTHQSSGVSGEIRTEKELGTLPPGVFDFGTYIFEPGSNHLKILARHQCGAQPWVTESVMIDWRRPSVAYPPSNTEK